MNSKDSDVEVLRNEFVSREEFEALKNTVEAIEAAFRDIHTAISSLEKVISKKWANIAESRFGSTVSFTKE